MSYIQDVQTMLRYQGLIDKEKKGTSRHPANALQRQRYERTMDYGVLSVGMNVDPRKVKFVQKMKEEEGEIIEPKRYYNVAKLTRRSDGALSPVRRLSVMSSHKNYLEQTQGIVKDPHGKGGGMGSGLQGEIPNELLKELLYVGTSEEYEGRYAYLKAKRLMMKPSQRVRQPLTAAQASSWALEDFNKTSEWAPRSITGNRGVMLRLCAEDAPTLEKSTRIVGNTMAMETILGIRVNR